MDDRNEEVIITWDFQQKNGAPKIAYEGITGFYVSQAVVNGNTIDVKTDFNTKPGKINNGSWTDWAQMNELLSLSRQPKTVSLLPKLIIRFPQQLLPVQQTIPVAK